MVVGVQIKVGTETFHDMMKVTNALDKTIRVTAEEMIVDRRQAKGYHKTAAMYIHTHVMSA